MKFFDQARSASSFTSSSIINSIHSSNGILTMSNPNALANAILEYFQNNLEIIHPPIENCGVLTRDKVSL